MNEQPKQRWGCLQWSVVIGVILLLVMLILPALPQKVAKIGRQSQAMNNCRQIILSLKQFAVDNGHAYPDARSSGEGLESANQVFRLLFKEGIVTDESIFGCPNSMFVPDGRIGVKPDFSRAVGPGECHWMLLKYQTDTSAGNAPLIIENGLTASWPPKWSLDTHSIRGRSWPIRRIISGRNDGSVVMETLNEDGTLDWHSKNNRGPDRKSWIDTLSPEQIAKLSYWDIEEK